MLKDAIPKQYQDPEPEVDTQLNSIPKPCQDHEPGDDIQLNSISKPCQDSEPEVDTQLNSVPKPCQDPQTKDYTDLQLMPRLYEDLEPDLDAQLHSPSPGEMYRMKSHTNRCYSGRRSIPNQVFEQHLSDNEPSGEAPPADTVCRVCLIKRFELYTVTNELQQFYEAVTRDEYNKVGYPVSMCYICLAKLRNCHRFVETARASHKVLERWYSQQHEMTVDKPQTTSTVTKEQPTPMEDEEVSSQRIKEEQMDLEPEYAEWDVKNEEDSQMDINREKNNIDDQLDIKNEPHYSIYNDTGDGDDDRPQDDKCLFVDQAPGTSSTLFQLDNIKTETPTPYKIKIEINTNTNDSTNHCSVCFKCDTEKDLANHTQFHDTSRPHVCDVCQYRFDDLIKLEKHQVKHFDDANEFYCDRCDFKIFSKRDFAKHMTVHTGELLSCYICNYKCREIRRSADHMRSHTGEKPYSCGICSEKFALKSTLNQHVKAKHTVEKPFSCSCCNFKTSRKDTLRSHMRTHTGENPFSCNIRHFKYRNKRRLTEHMRKHTNDTDEKPFLCDICSEKFASKSSLEQHVKSIHTNKKPFSCNICSYRTSRKDAMKPHMRMHTGEKPFSCYIGVTRLPGSDTNCSLDSTIFMI